MPRPMIAAVTLYDLATELVAAADRAAEIGYPGDAADLYEQAEAAEKAAAAADAANLVEVEVPEDLAVVAFEYGKIPSAL